MKAPEINISFMEQAKTVVERTNRGVVALCIGDKPVLSKPNPFIVVDKEDIPQELGDTSKDQIKLALKGYKGISPQKIIVYCMNIPHIYTDEELKNMTTAEIRKIAEDCEYKLGVGEAASLEVLINEFKSIQKKTIPEALGKTLESFETIRFNYMAITNIATIEKVEDVTKWITQQRSKNIKVKAVLPNAEADCEGIINYAVNKNVVTETTKVNGTQETTEFEYTAEQFCSRIAGLLAATPITYSATYAVMEDMIDCEKVENLDEAVNAGKFVVFNDGENIKTCRAINSLVDITETQSEDWKKIKIVEIMDIISDDIRRIAENDYLGKYPNTYDNKCILITAISSYLNQLQKDNVIDSYSIEIDINATKTYLKDKGVDISIMSDDEIKKAKTGSKVFLQGTIGILDAIEDLYLPIYM